MKKLFLSLIVFTASGVLLLSCGGSSNSLVKDAVSKAEAEVAIEENTFIGSLPSLALQQESAQKAVRKAIEEQIKELGTPSSEADYKSFEEKVAKINSGAEEALLAIRTEYYGKYAEAEKNFIGKEVPSEFDKNLFSSAKCTIESFPDTTGVKIKAVLTPVGKGKMVCALWDYCDEKGNKLSSGASYDIDKSGDNITVEIITNLVSLNKAAKIKFRKP